jgi:hypothetical protein
MQVIPVTQETEGKKVPGQLGEDSDTLSQTHNKNK